MGPPRRSWGRRSAARTAPLRGSRRRSRWRRPGPRPQASARAGAHRTGSPNSTRRLRRQQLLGLVPVSRPPIEAGTEYSSSRSSVTIRPAPFRPLPNQWSSTSNRSSLNTLISFASAARLASLRDHVRSHIRSVPASRGVTAPVGHRPAQCPRRRSLRERAGGARTRSIHHGTGWSAVAWAVRSEKANDPSATSSSKLPKRMPLGAVARSATATISVPTFQRTSCARRRRGRPSGARSLDDDAQPGSEEALRDAADEEEIGGQPPAARDRRRELDGGDDRRRRGECCAARGECARGHWGTRHPPAGTPDTKGRFQ